MSALKIKDSHPKPHRISPLLPQNPARRPGNLLECGRNPGFMPWYPGSKPGTMKSPPLQIRDLDTVSSHSPRHASSHAPNLGNADPWGWGGAPSPRAPPAAFPFPSSARSADPPTFPSRASDPGAAGGKHPGKSNTGRALLEEISMLPTRPARRIPRGWSWSSISLFPEMSDSNCSGHKNPSRSTISWIF